MKFPETVFVRNNGPVTFTNKYDGEDFEIKPGQILQIHQGAAELVFGFGSESKLKCLRRLGWVETNGDLSKGLERLNTFSFHSTEREARDHNARKPIAPANGKVEGGPPEEESSGGKTSRTPVNLLGKLAAVAQPAA